MTTYLDYRVVTRTLPQRIDAIANDQMTKREIAYFKANIGKITTGDELIKDYRLYSFAMKAFGLEEQIYAKGLMRKVFNEGVMNSKSMANLLSDENFKEIATTFGFAETGNLNMQIQSNVDDVVSSYLRQIQEEHAGEDNEGVRLALYFDRKAVNIDNWYEVLGDPALSQVVRTAFGLPEAFAQTDVDRQVQYFENKMSIEDLKDPEKRKDLIGRFTALWDISEANSLSGIDLASNGIVPIQPLSSSGPQLVSIDPALLVSLRHYQV